MKNEKKKYHMMIGTVGSSWDVRLAEFEEIGNEVVVEKPSSYH